MKIMNYLEKKIRIKLFLKPVFFVFVTALFLVNLSSCDEENKEPELPKPTLTGIEPNTGTLNEIVKIDGTNFGVDAKIVSVKFQDSIGVVQRVSDTQIEVIIPEEAGDGPLTITIGENVLTSEVFTYIPFIVEGPQVSTLAGSGAGFADGTGEDAKFAKPHGVAVDADGNVFVADFDNHSVRKITPDGVVTTYAGTGEAGFADGPATTAQFAKPAGVAVDAMGNVYVADLDNNRIRKISPTGDVITMAGTGVEGSADGAGSVATFGWPIGVVLDTDGNVYVAGATSLKIRKVTPEGFVTTIAGSTLGFADGTGEDAKFDIPHGITIDAARILYVADKNNCRIRKVTQDGVVTTLAGGACGYADGTGSAAQFNLPRSLGSDADGNVYVGDTDNNYVRLVDPDGVVTTIAGSVKGWEDGPGADAKFNAPRGIAVGLDGLIYVADQLNNRIRKIEIVE